jgi:hypothetical protein
MGEPGPRRLDRGVGLNAALDRGTQLGAERICIVLWRLAAR